MSFSIDVTQTDIDIGIRGSGVTCAISRSLNRNFPRWEWVTSQTAVISCTRRRPDREEWLLPADVVEWLRRYDDGLRVYPFKLTIPQDVAIRYEADDEHVG